MNTREMGEWLIAAARRERGATVEMLKVLGAFEEARGPELAGCSTLFVYCTQVLKIGESTAYRQVLVARMMRRAPRIAGMLERGETSISALAALAAVVEVESPDVVLDWAVGKTEKEALRYAAEVVPRPAVRETVKPIDGKTWELTVVVDEDTGAKLHEAATILSHVIPDRSQHGALLAKLLEVALPQLRAQRYAGLLGDPALPRGSDDCDGSKRRPSRSVARAVYERDEFACTYRGEDGRRCCETWQTELHHRIPWGRGGRSTVENLTVHCKSHNRLEGERAYGRSHMDRHRQG